MATEQGRTARTVNLPPTCAQKRKESSQKHRRGAPFFATESSKVNITVPGIQWFTIQPIQHQQDGTGHHPVTLIITYLPTSTRNHRASSCLDLSYSPSAIVAAARQHRSNIQRHLSYVPTTYGSSKGNTLADIPTYLLAQKGFGNSSPWVHSNQLSITSYSDDVSRPTAYHRYLPTKAQSQVINFTFIHSTFYIHLYLRIIFSAIQSQYNSAKLYINTSQSNFSIIFLTISFWTKKSSQ